jgi:hypothetical protein
MRNQSEPTTRTSVTAGDGRPHLLGMLHGAGRAAAYAAWAGERGLGYLPSARRHVHLDRAYALVRRCRDGVGVRHLCRGRIDSLAVLAFECRPTREDPGCKLPALTGRHVVVLSDLPLALPRFALLPNRTRERLWVGWQRLTGRVERVHTVRDGHLLFGADEAALRGMFDARLAAFLDGQRGCAFESNGRELLAYRPLEPGYVAACAALLDTLLAFWSLAARQRLGGRSPASPRAS